MKTLVQILLAVPLMFGIFTYPAYAYVTVDGYYKSNGTYVNSYVRSEPNAFKYDNYGYSGGDLYNDSYYEPTKNYSSDW